MQNLFPRNDKEKKPRFVLGKGSNGTELYVKVVSPIETMFRTTGRDQGGGVELWFGNTKLTNKHKLGQNGERNKYYLIENVGSGQYRLENKDEVSEVSVEKKLREGRHKYIELVANRETGRKWGTKKSFGGDQCKYNGNGHKWEEGGGVRVRCRQTNQGKGGDRYGKDGDHVTVNLTKNDYVLN